MRAVLRRLAVVSLLRSVSAQPDNVPLCAGGCWDYASSLDNVCSQTNASCVCLSNEFLATVACCVGPPQCSEADQSATLDAAEQFCADFGIGSQVSALPSDCLPRAAISLPSSSAPSAVTSSISTTPSSSTSSSSSSSEPFSDSSSVIIAETSSPMSINGSPAASRTFPTSSFTHNSPSASDAKPTSSSTHIIPTAASIIPAPIFHPAGLSTGAKAGIAIGVTLGFTILAFLLFLFLSHWKHRRTVSQSDVYPKEAELPTKANIHEIGSGKKSILNEVESDPEPYYPFELEGQLGSSQPVLADTTIVNQNKSDPQDTNVIRGPLGANELWRDRYPIQAETSSISDNQVTGLNTVESRSQTSDLNRLDTHCLSKSISPVSSPVSGSTAMPDNESKRSLSKLDILLASREKIRIEKERLSRLQELEEMEAQLQHEIARERSKDKEKG